MFSPPLSVEALFQIYWERQEHQDLENMASIGMTSHDIARDAALAREGPFDPTDLGILQDRVSARVKQHAHFGDFRIFVGGLFFYTIL